MFSKWVMWLWIGCAVLNWIASVGILFGVTECVFNLIQAIVWTGGVIWGIRGKRFTE